MSPLLLCCRRRCFYSRPVFFCIAHRCFVYFCAVLSISALFLPSPSHVFFGCQLLCFAFSLAALAVFIVTFLSVVVFFPTKVAKVLLIWQHHPPKMQTRKKKQNLQSKATSNYIKPWYINSYILFKCSIAICKVRRLHAPLGFMIAFKTTDRQQMWILVRKKMLQNLFLHFWSSVYEKKYFFVMIFSKKSVVLPNLRLRQTKQNFLFWNHSPPPHYFWKKKYVFAMIFSKKSVVLPNLRLRQTKQSFLF